MRRVFAVIASVALAVTIGLANGAAGERASEEEAFVLTQTACALALQYADGTGLVSQQLAGSIKVVKDFKGHVPQSLKPDESRLVDDISAHAGTLEFDNALASLVLACNNTGVTKLTAQQLLDLHEEIGQFPGDASG